MRRNRIRGLSPCTPCPAGAAREGSESATADVYIKLCTLFMLKRTGLCAHCARQNAQSYGVCACRMRCRMAVVTL
eukprot:4775767-Alexandrium_andersonii.AAC.1